MNRKIYQHRCRWLFQPKKEEGKYDKEHWPKAVLFCWQTGKEIRERECTPCLLARFLTIDSRMVNSLPGKQPMTLKEWQKHHKQRGNREEAGNENHQAQGNSQAV